MQCDASKYDLFVEVPAKFKGVVDLKDHSGEDAAEVLGLLLAEGCSAVVRPAKRARKGRFAAWEGNGFAFKNFFLNTAEVAERVEVDPARIVECIKAGVLTGFPTPNDFFYLVARDRKFEGLTHIRALAAKVPMKRSVKGKGLTRIVLAFAKLHDFPASDFCIEDLKSTLEREADWKAGRDYEEVSFGFLMLKLEKTGDVVRVVDSPKDIGSRRWSFVTRRAPLKESVVGQSVPAVAAAVAPSPATVGSKKAQMVEELAEELVEQAKQRARELLGL